MGYYDDQKTANARAGQAIYINALSSRRGFRSDQTGIPEDDEVWDEIFEAIGAAARNVEHIFFLDDA
jgi:hypothetical protein